MPPFYWIDWKLVQNAHSTAFYYFESFYYGLIGGLGAGEMGPVTEVDLFLSSVIMIFGAIMNASALARMMLLLDEVNSSEQKVQGKI